MTAPNIWCGSRPTRDRLDLGNGYAVAECIRTDGDRDLWLLSLSGDTSQTLARVPAHEALGPLPPVTVDALDTAFGAGRLIPQCAGICWSGARCRNRPRPGARFCHHHEDQDQNTTEKARTTP